MDSEHIYELKFFYYQPVHLVSKDRDKLSFAIDYVTDDFEVNMQMQGDSRIIDIKDGELAGYSFVSIDKFEFYCKNRDGHLAGLFEGDRDDSTLEQTYKCLAKIINRVLRSIRMWGPCPEVHEIIVESQFAKPSLRYWELQLQIDNSGWAKILKDDPESFLKDLFNPYRRGIGLGGTAYIYSTSFRDIKEAIEDDTVPYPEDEIEVNVYEHLREHDYRLAVLESVIALELVLTEYLRTHLQKKYNFSEIKLNDFLSANLTLKTRIDHLLPIMIPQNVVSGVDFEAVKKMISWRNHITHTHGKLPQDATPDSVSKRVIALLTLTELLRREQLKVSSESFLSDISDSLNKVFKVTAWLTRTDVRRFHLAISVFFGFKLDVTKFESILEFVSEKLRGSMPRFDKIKDLTARVSGVIDHALVYKNGKIEISEPSEPAKRFVLRPKP